MILNFALEKSSYAQFLSCWLEHKHIPCVNLWMTVVLFGIGHLFVHLFSEPRVSFPLSLTFYIFFLWKNLSWPWINALKGQSILYNLCIFIKEENNGYFETE